MSSLFFFFSFFLIKLLESVIASLKVHQFIKSFFQHRRYKALPVDKLQLFIPANTQITPGILTIHSLLKKKKQNQHIFLLVALNFCSVLHFKLYYQGNCNRCWRLNADFALELLPVTSLEATLRFKWGCQ